MRRLFPIAVVALVFGACVGEDPTDPPAPVGPDASTDGPGGETASDAPIADTGGDTDSGPSFVCPMGALFCETWDDDPLLDGWMQEVGNGHTLGSIASTRSPPRALSATLLDTPIGRAYARLTRNLTVADVAKLTLRFDARIARRDSPLDGGVEGELKIAGLAMGGFASFVAYKSQSLTLHYSRSEAGGVMAGPSASFAFGQWHTVEVILQRKPTPMLTLRVDGGAVAPAADLGVTAVPAVRVILGADSEIEGASAPSGASEVELDNVVLLAE